MHQKHTCGAMQSNMYWNNMAEYSNIIVVITIVPVIIFNAGFFYIMYKKRKKKSFHFVQICCKLVMCIVSFVASLVINKVCAEIKFFFFLCFSDYDWLKCRKKHLQ